MLLKPNSDVKCPACGAAMSVSDDDQKILMLDHQGTPVRLAMYRPVRGADGNIEKYQRDPDKYACTNIEFNVCPSCGHVEFRAVNIGPESFRPTETTDKAGKESEAPDAKA